MSTKRLGVAVAVLGGYLYAVGGSDGSSPLNSGKIISIIYLLPFYQLWYNVNALKTNIYIKFILTLSFSLEIFLKYFCYHFKIVLSCISVN